MNFLLAIFVYTFCLFLSILAFSIFILLLNRQQISFFVTVSPCACDARACQATAFGAYSDGICRILLVFCLAINALLFVSV